MPITLTPYAHPELCCGSTWEVTDEQELAKYIAKIALGQSAHIQRILTGGTYVAGLPSANQIAGAIKLLEVHNNNVAHRDGWMFQAISWIAAQLGAPNTIITPPHIRSADKGFDGLQLNIDQSGTITSVTIFEDKATTRPRDVIRAEVWPDFARFESGEDENVLVHEISSLLQRRPDLDGDSVVNAVIWKDVRQYRVSITVKDTHSTEAGRRRLFKNYDSIAEGDVTRRRGETFLVNNLRVWMQALASKAILHLRSQGT